MVKFKYAKLYSLLCVSSLILFACDSNDTENETSDEELPSADTDDNETEVDDDTATDDDTDDSADMELSQDLEVWFPKSDNTLYDFEGIGMEFTPFTRYPQFVHDDTVQIVESSAGTDTVRVYEYSDNEIREIFMRGETYFRDDMMETELENMAEEDIVLLQLPIEVGHTWDSLTGTQSEITDAGFEYETAFGTFNAIEVTRYGELSDTIYYFAESIGLVEEVYNPGDEEVVSRLDSLQEDSAEEFSLELFYLNEQADRLLTQTVSFGLNTNDLMRDKLTDIFQGNAPESDVPALISENTTLTTLYYGADDIAYADFSAELTQEMTAGSGTEELILQAIVNTIGTYYNVNEVLMTVEGQPYASGHIELAEGETWTVTQVDDNAE